MSAFFALIPGAAVQRQFAAAVAAFLLCCVSDSAFALAVSPASLTVKGGSSANAIVTGTGAFTATSAKTSIATVSWTTTNTAGTTNATLAVKGVGLGSTTVTVKDATAATLTFNVTVTPNLTVTPGSVSVATGASASVAAKYAAGNLTVSSANTTIATVPASVTTSGGAGSFAVTAQPGDASAGFTIVRVSDGASTVYVPVSVLTSASTKAYAVLAWNNLGMHCMDGNDYSVFSILPPYNDLHAQIVSRSSWAGPVAPRSVTGIATTNVSGISLKYQSVADLANSINTFSASKTNFWSYVNKLYVAPTTTIAQNCGLTGNYTPSLTARLLAYSAGAFASGGNTFTWFEATGLPITPIDDNYQRNEYPTVKLLAYNGTTQVASTTTVLPVSDEISCKNCHASSTVAAPSYSDMQTTWDSASSTWSATAATRVYALPTTPVNNADAEKDWKFNILKKHDERRGTSLYPDALGGQPTLCASCHASNALGTTGTAGTPPLTASMHGNHAYASDPKASNALLNDQSNRSACYSCHPGSTTKCLRGAMSNVSDVQCQSCHGNMAKVGGARVGWLDQPTCQACHYQGTRQVTAFTGNSVTVPTDRTFATNANTPGTGYSLFRFSKGHGSMQCEACHGATHAEYPSEQPNDNIQSIALQGYKGTVRECVACHNSPPEDARLNLGPHGMHWTGPVWVSKHKDLAQKNIGSCAYCHSTGYTAGMTTTQINALPFTGTALSDVKSARTFLGKKTQQDGSKLVRYSPDGISGANKVGCYDCHNGPSGQ